MPVADIDHPLPIMTGCRGVSPWNDMNQECWQVMFADAPESTIHSKGVWELLLRWRTMNSCSGDSSFDVMFMSFVVSSGLSFIFFDLSFSLLDDPNALFIALSAIFLKHSPPWVLLQWSHFFFNLLSFVFSFPLSFGLSFVLSFVGPLATSVDWETFQDFSSMRICKTIESVANLSTVDIRMVWRVE